MLTPAVALAAQRVWGIDLERAVPLGGSTGLNLLAGAWPRRVVVRVHRHHVNASRVEALQLARAAAAAAGIPTARTILGRDGERHVSVDGCVMEVERFVAGDAKMDGPLRLRAAMPMFARLHDALAAAELPDAADELRFGNHVSAAEVVTRTVEGTRRLRTLGGSLRRTADAAEALAWQLGELGSRTGASPSQWCHGDFWDDNVVFRDGEIVLVADFGFMNRRPRVDDLALTLYFVLCELDAARHGDPSAVLAGLVDAYDRGTRRPLSDAERGEIPVALARQPLWSIAVWAAELDDPAEIAAHLRGHDTVLRRARSLLEDIDRWGAAFMR